MRKETPLFTTLVMLFALAICPARAMAISTGEAIVTIDWSSLTITTTGGVVAYDPWSSSYADVSNSVVELDQGLEELSGIVDTSASASVAGAMSEAKTTDGNLFARSYTDPVPGMTSWTWADASRDYYLENLGTSTGDVTLTLDYYLDLNLSTGSTGDWADGWAYASVQIFNDSTNDDTESWDELWKLVFDGDDFNGVYTGALSATLGFEPGEVGNFTIYAAAASNARAPEPSTALLFGVGLLGWGLFRRVNKTG